MSNNLFPMSNFGQYVLTRDRVVRKVMEEVASQLALHPSDSPSVYLSGCRGSGKTSLLMLLAKFLKGEGFEVYFFESAQDIPQGAGWEFEAMLEDENNKVAVLIDEVASDPNSGLFTALLKGSYPNLVTIGASVPLYSPHPASFDSLLRMTDLVLREDDEDFQKLVQYCVELKATTPALTRAICKYLLEQCGGHTFPTLAFIEHFFTRDEVRGLLANKTAFDDYFRGPYFACSPFYQLVRNMCFEQLLNAEIEKVAFRVMGGKEEAGDISTMIQLGWWNRVTGDFISRFLVNACVSGVECGALFLDQKKSHEETTELLIVEGLAGMDDSDFNCLQQHTSSVKVQNGVSFNWAQKARAKFRNVHLPFQKRGSVSVVDFYLNDDASSTAIQVMADANLQGYDASDYPWQRRVIFNFADWLSLPGNTAVHDKVYTFMRSTNTLYRGTTPIKTPAVPQLSGGSSFVRPAGQTRSFSTVVAKRFMTGMMRRW